MEGACDRFVRAAAEAVQKTERDALPGRPNVCEAHTFFIFWV